MPSSRHHTAQTFLAGQNWLYFCADERLFGQIYWGRPSGLDIERLFALWQVELSPATPPHSSYIDCRRLDTVSAEHFQAMATELTKNRALLGTKVQRQAIVRPPGLAGAVVAGIASVLPLPYPLQVFAEPKPALEWLSAPSLETELERLVLEVNGDDALVRALRHHLGSNLEATLASASVELAVSTRTLQRRLLDIGSSFRSELQSARIERAQELLANSDNPITNIALSVGCGSAQRFSEFFRRATNTTP